MSYLIEPIKVPIDEEIENALYHEGIEVRAISIRHHLFFTYRRVAFELRDALDIGLGRDKINSNFKAFENGLKRACEKLEKKDPDKYGGLYDSLLRLPMKKGTFKEYKNPKHAETFV